MTYVIIFKKIQTFFYEMNHIEEGLFFCINCIFSYAMSVFLFFRTR